MVDRSALTRRALLRTGAAAGSAPLLGRGAAGQTAACGAAPSAVTERPQKAVSLRQVSESLAAGKPLRLEGFTRLDGYVVDDDNKDVVIYGIHETGEPELQAPDFVVALRAQFKRSSGRQNDADYSKPAAISLDPDPEVYRRLNGVNTLTAEGQRQYADVCRLPQTVRVDGMQRHTRVAKILVDADYRMKKVSAGTETLPIASPFSGDFDAVIRDWRAAIDAGKPPSDIAGITRYWFTPGRFTHGEARENRNMIRFGFTQVVLKDEVDLYSSDRKMTATGKTNPYARAFTCAWSERMEDTFRADPLLQEMRNMFRWFALARIMRDLDAFTQAGLDPEFLLERYQVPRVEVPATLPGVSRVETAQRHDGKNTWNYAKMVCGGVDIGFKAPIEMEEDRDGTIARGGRTVLASRPAPTGLAWNVTRARLFNP